MRTPERILIIRLSSLGDILHALPAFGCLRRSFPGARIDWLIEKRNSFLLSAVRGIDDVITLDTLPLRNSPWNPASWKPGCDLVRLLRARHYDCCIDFQGLLKTGFLSFLSGARTRIGFPRELVRERPAHWFYQRTPGAPPEPRHVVALNRLLAQSAGAEDSPGRVDFVAEARDDEHVQALLEAEGLGDFVVINPGGGWPTKRWHPARYGRLAARIRSELGLRVAVTTGPGEENLYEEVLAHSGGSAPRNVRVPFLQLIPLLRRTRLFIGGDTGPFHLACLVGTPVVGVFGPTSPLRNGPWQNGGESVFRTLSCSFCNGRTCPTDNECMDIPVEEVFRAVARRIERCR